MFFGLGERLGTHIGSQTMSDVAAGRDERNWLLELYLEFTSGPVAFLLTFHLGRTIDSCFLGVVFASALMTNNRRSLVSVFDLMTDELFATYAAYGITSRSQLIITKAERDAAPLQCDSQGQFATPGSLPNWVQLSSFSVSSSQ